ncbi:MAG: phenylalanyl-tRNA synthetase beta chain, partial [Chloroflexota bacterium]|nr:phenylalanyl-tRNA synthetase beta chain [Chloroflexota bacterium]
AVTTSRHPAAERDLAIVVNAGVAAAAIGDALRAAAGPHLIALELFDIYRGAPLDSDEKSLAWRLVLQAEDRSLTDPEIDATIVAVSAAATAVGGRIRT